MHSSVSAFAPHDHPRSVALFILSKRFMTSIFPSVAADTSVIVPFRPTAGMIAEICAAYGAVRMINFAPPSAWKYSTTSTFEESTCSWAPSVFARSPFEDPEETAYTLSPSFAAYLGSCKLLVLNQDKKKCGTTHLNGEVTKASYPLHYTNITRIPFACSNGAVDGCPSTH